MYNYQRTISIITWVGMPFAAVVGWFLAVLRFRHFARLLELFRTVLEHNDGKVTDVSGRKGTACIAPAAAPRVNGQV